MIRTGEQGCVCACVCACDVCVRACVSVCASMSVHTCTCVPGFWHCVARAGSGRWVRGVGSPPGDWPPGPVHSLPAGERHPDLPVPALADGPGAPAQRCPRPRAPEEEPPGCGPRAPGLPMSRSSREVPARLLPFRRLQGPRLVMAAGVAAASGQSTALLKSPSSCWARAVTDRRPGRSPGRTLASPPPAAGFRAPLHSGVSAEAKGHSGGVLTTPSSGGCPCGCEGSHGGTLGLRLPVGPRPTSRSAVSSQGDWQLGAAGTRVRRGHRCSPTTACPVPPAGQGPGGAWRSWEEEGNPG